MTQLQLDDARKIIEYENVIKSIEKTLKKCNFKLCSEMNGVMLKVEYQISDEDIKKVLKDKKEELEEMIHFLMNKDYNRKPDFSGLHNLMEGIDKIIKERNEVE